MAVKRVIFIRPGETDWNRDLRYQGWVAIPLSAYGQRQAQRLANYIRNIGVSALYTSDLKRASETAAILAEKLDSEPIADKRLRERDIGKWQGLTRKCKVGIPMNISSFFLTPMAIASPVASPAKMSANVFWRPSMIF
jgi:broad specificity phosphatase PhoE